MLVSERINNDISCTNDHFAPLRPVPSDLLSLPLDLLQILLVLHADLFLLPHDFYGLAVALVGFNYFLDGDHADELLFFVDSLLVCVHFYVLVEFLYKALVTMQAWVEVAHEELYYHLRYLLAVGDVHLFILVIEAD